MSVQVTMRGALYWATSPSIGHRLHRLPARYDTPSRYLREVAAMVELQGSDALSNHLAESLGLEVGVWQRHRTVDRVALAVHDLRAWCRSGYCRASVYSSSAGRRLLVLSQRRDEPMRAALAHADQAHRETPLVQCYDFAEFGEVTVFLPGAPMDVHYAGHCFAAGDLVDPHHPGLVARAHYALVREARRAVGRAVRRMKE